MRAAGIREFGRDIELLDLPEPRGPAADEVVLRVRAAAVGVWEDEIRTGGWDIGRRPPMALGVEGAGVVEEVGAEVTGLAPGDAAVTYPLPLRDQGAWAELLVAPAALTVAKPASLAWSEAAALPVVGITALQVIEDTLRVQAGERVLVCGAGGATGGGLVQVAALAGAVVVATASEASAARVRSYGAAEVVDYHDPGWPERVRAPADGGVDAAAVAAPGASAAALPAVRDGGRLATIVADPPREERGITVVDFVLDPDGATLVRAVTLAAEGRLRVPVTIELPLERAPEALQRATVGANGGAVVLTIAA